MTSIASFEGLSAFVAVSYAFYADAEVVGPAEEIRTVFVPSDLIKKDHLATLAEEPRNCLLSEELRYVFAPYENRVYEVAGKQLAGVAPNRRRKLRCRP
jgi:hypothetical protein